MAIDALTWVNNKVSDEQSQQKLNDYAKLLITGPLKDKGEYAQEKALKVYSEIITFLESRLQYQEGIHHKQIDPVEFAMNREKMLQSYLKVKKQIEEEIERIYNLFLVFLQDKQVQVKDALFEETGLKHEASDKVLSDYIERLNEGLLREKSENARNAGIKLFSEGLLHLENTLMHQKGLHSNQLSLNSMKNGKSNKALDELERIMDVEIRRQYRHFTTFAL